MFCGRIGLSSGGVELIGSGICGGIGLLGGGTGLLSGGIGLPDGGIGLLGGGIGLPGGGMVVGCIICDSSFIISCC